MKLRVPKTVTATGVARPSWITAETVLAVIPAQPLVPLTVPEYLADQLTQTTAVPASVGLLVKLHVRKTAMETGEELLT